MTYRTANARERMTSIATFAYRIKTYRTTFAGIGVTYWTAFARTC